MACETTVITTVDNVIILIYVCGKELAESTEDESCSDLDSPDDDGSVLNGEILCI